MLLNYKRPKTSFGSEISYDEVIPNVTKITDDVRNYWMMIIDAVWAAGFGTTLGVLGVVISEEKLKTLVFKCNVIDKLNVNTNALFNVKEVPFDDIRNQYTVISSNSNSERISELFRDLDVMESFLSHI